MVEFEVVVFKAGFEVLVVELEAGYEFEVVVLDAGFEVLVVELEVLHVG